MAKQNFVIIERNNVEHGVVFDVFTDNVDGFAAFAAKHLPAAQPGTTVDIADAKCCYRMRNDGTWEILTSYSDSLSEGDAMAAAGLEEIQKALQALA